MKIRLLGQVSACTDAGEPVDVGPAKCQAVLAGLALSAGSAVPVSRLVELVWGETPPRTAERTLQSYVTRLRRGLGPDAITRIGAAYCLDLPADSVDALRFQRKLRVGDVQAALAEWTAPPLAGLDVPGLSATTDALVERWLGAIEANLADRVDTDPKAAIGPLTELTANHPYREGLWALLMTALYRADRQADALAAYRTARTTLVDELGIEPGPRLRELESMILGHDGQLLDAPRPVEPQSEPSDLGNLPARPRRLIGRDHYLETVAEAMSTSPVVTLVGPGGIGKTTLALAAAQRGTSGYADGVWLVELADISRPSDVALTIADCLGVTEAPGRTLAESIVAALRRQQALLVLDNCEHVIDTTSQLAQDIVEACPDVQVLATSREALGIRHERRIVVEPLDPDQAGADLFNERARALSAQFQADADRDTVTAICRRLDGLPLAIELAAARAKTMSPTEILQRLDIDPELLGGNRRSDGDRHQTLRATIQWSYDLLSLAEQALFGRLCVFTGPFDLLGAEVVGAHSDLEAGHVGVVLDQLVERSMVVVEDGRFGHRFRVLETMRQFAVEHVESESRDPIISTRHADWCLDRVTAIGVLLAGPGELEGVARLDELWTNLRSAVGWACATNDYRLAHALIGPTIGEILLRSRHEIGDWLEQALAVTPVEEADTIAFGLSWAARRYALNQQFDAYEQLADRYGNPQHPLTIHARAFVHADYRGRADLAAAASTALRRRGDHHLAQLTDIDIGGSLLNTGHFAEHDAHVEALVERFLAHGPPTCLNWALMLLGYSAVFQGDPERSQRHFEEAISFAIPDRTHSPNKPIEARVLFRRGEHAKAFKILSTHLDDLLETDNMQGGSIACIEFINMMVAIDRIPDAACMLDYLESTNLLDAPGWRSLIANAEHQIADSADTAPAEPRIEPAWDDRQALEFMRDAL